MRLPSSYRVVALPLLLPSFTNFVEEEFSELPLRNCPKSLGRTCSVALGAPKKGCLVYFAVPIPAKFTLGAALESLFGQFLNGVLGSSTLWRGPFDHFVLASPAEG